MPEEDATTVRLLREAGAIPVGKTNTVEFAFGPTGSNQTYGMPRNPWGQGRMPGGSSSGTGSGVASGFFPMGLGSDTGGSIRIPSALCGISGIKPTFGLVSRFGVTPLSHSLDTAGPMARTVEDLALILNVLAAPDERDPVSITAPKVDYVASLQGGVSGLRIGVPVQYVWEPLDTDVALAFESAMRALEGLGAQVMEISLPELDWTPPIAAGITTAEAAMAHGARVLQYGDRMDQAIRRRFESGFFVPATAYARAQQARIAYARAVAQALTRVDLIAMPTVATPAPLAEQVMLTLGGVEIIVEGGAAAADPRVQPRPYAERLRAVRVLAGRPADRPHAGRRAPERRARAPRRVRLPDRNRLARAPRPAVRIVASYETQVPLFEALPEIANPLLGLSKGLDCPQVRGPSPPWVHRVPPTPLAVIPPSSGIVVAELIQAEIPTGLKRSMRNRSASVIQTGWTVRCRHQKSETCRLVV